MALDSEPGGRGLHGPDREIIARRQLSREAMARHWREHEQLRKHDAEVSARCQRLEALLGICANVLRRLAINSIRQRHAARDYYLYDQDMRRRLKSAIMGVAQLMCADDMEPPDVEGWTRPMSLLDLEPPGPPPLAPHPAIPHTTAHVDANGVYVAEPQPMADPPPERATPTSLLGGFMRAIEHHMGGDQ